MRLLPGQFFSSLNVGSALLVGLFAVGYPLALAGHYSHTIELNAVGGLVPEVVWKGQVWRLFTYAFLAGSILDWLVSWFWLATLVFVLGRNWSGAELWRYCLLCSVIGGSCCAALLRDSSFAIVGNGAMILGLLAAWQRLYGRERIILLGFGELSVRQAALIVALIELLLLLFGLGWQAAFAMILGGCAGWLFLILRGKHALNRHSRTIDSARIARLEL